MKNEIDEKAFIALSILGYENELSKKTGKIPNSKEFTKILKLVNSGLLYSIHIDIMRPPLIANRSSFSIKLLQDLCSQLQKKIRLEFHLMVSNPIFFIREINKFVDKKEMKDIFFIIQREAFESDEEVIKRLKEIRCLGYKAGIGLNFPTPFKELTNTIIQNSDLVLIMSVPMGEGGQKFENAALKRIKSISKRYPKIPIKVDGGINNITIKIVITAGAKIVVIGSFITKSIEPVKTLEMIRKIIREIN
jgi:ribulose-phosphate 3-epimerase